MIPLVDIHCHLLAGLDDGPQSDEEALEMCRIAYEDGVRTVAATAHQNESWPEATCDRIRDAARRLAKRLKEAHIPLLVTPSAEVMVHPEIERSWRQGKLLSVADRSNYLLLELPHNLFVDLRETVMRLRAHRVRPILAHAERSPVLLHERGRIEQLIEAGCLVQVNAKSVTQPSSSKDQRALRRWFKQGVVHVVASDGHSPTERPPMMAEAYRQIAAMVSPQMADRVCSTNGLAIIQGLPPPASGYPVSLPQPRLIDCISRFFRV